MRRRRRYRIGRVPTSILVAAGVLGLAVAGAIAFSGNKATVVDKAAARRELAVSLRLFDSGQATAARSHALKAVAADPDWGLAHAVLARTYLELGEGALARASLERAVDNGFAAARAHHLRAEAMLAQGDAGGAIAEAQKAPDRYEGYALRIAARAMATKGRLPEAQRILAQLLAASNGNNGQAWIDLGRVRQMTGDIAGAIDASARAIALAPNNGRALVLRGEMVRTQYGLVASLPWFEAALQRDPWNHDALVDYAATLGDVGRYVDMLAATRRALAVRPASPRALYLLAVLAARAGNEDLARELLRRGWNSLNTVPGALMLGAVLDYTAGAYEQATLKLRAVVGQQPMNIPARRLLGAALLQSGDAKGALDILRPVAVRADADSYTLTLVGRAFERTGERDWAARFLDRAANPALGPSTPFGADDELSLLASAARQSGDSPIAIVGYIRGLIAGGELNDALTDSATLAKAYPGAPAAQLLIGDTLMEMKRYSEAAAAYRRAAATRFDEPTMLRAADASDRAGNREQAAAIVALFLSQNPHNVAARRIVAHWQMASGDWDDAIDTLEGLRADVGNRDAALLAELANAYAGADEADTATSYAAAGYALAPLNPAVVDAYGWSLYQGGANRPALALLQKAVAIAPGHVGLRWHLAQVAAELGRKDEARTNLRRILADPLFSDRGAAEALLKSIG